jgi:serralysin
MGTTSDVTPSGDAYVDGLIAGRRWSSALTWSLPTQASQYEPGYTDQAALTSNFLPLNASQVAAANDAIELVDSYIAAPLAFLGNNGLGHIRFANSDAASNAYSYYPDGTDSTGGDIFIGPAENNRTPIFGSYGWHTFAHELGHAFGLKHPFEAGDEPAFAGKTMPLDRDGIEFTVMTYKSKVGAANNYTNEEFGYPTSFMQYDILALQYLYGANYGSNAGHTTYSWDADTGQQFIDGVAQAMPGANRIFMTVWDGDGHDIYDFTNYTTDLLISLAPGGWSVLSAAQLADLDSDDFARGNVFNAFLVDGDTRPLIEEVQAGTGNDSITGNEAANSVFGNQGNDTIWGAGGDDYIDGSFGDDIVHGDAGNESVFGGAGQDTLYGGDGDDNLGGDLGNDLIYGGDGVNILQGWIGNDTMFGGKTDDSLYGGVGDDFAEGGDDSDVFYGNDGNDTLIGGLGGDQILAGAGNDTIFGGIEDDDIDANFGDDVVFAGNGDESIFGGTGNDTVFGEGGNDDIEGHEGIDTLFGGDGIDILTGGGGNDSLFGGAGNDTLFGWGEDDRFVYDSIAGGSGTDHIVDFGGGDRVQLVGMSIGSLSGTTAVLGDGSTLIAGNGHGWITGDFV